MAIRNFFVMDTHGMILFSDEFSNPYSPDLVGGFISAIHNFMKQTLYTGDIETLEVGGLRFIFEQQDIGEEDCLLFYVVLADRTENIASLKPKLTEIKWKFNEMFYNDLKNLKSGERGQFESFKPIEREIFDRKPVEISKQIESQLLIHFEKFYSSTEFVLGAALLTQSGTILFSFIENNLMENILRTLEGRFHSGFTKIQTILSQEKDGILVLIGGEKVIFAALFRRDCPFNTALMLSTNFSETLVNIIDEFNNSK